MIYRFLRREEFFKVAPMFQEMACEIPPKMQIFAGEENGQIVSFQCAHLVCHLGPVWVHPTKRGRGLWKQMQEVLESKLPHGFGFYQFGTEKNASQLKRMGLTPTNWRVWFKKIGGVPFHSAAS